MGMLYINCLKITSGYSLNSKAQNYKKNRYAGEKVDGDIW